MTRPGAVLCSTALGAAFVAGSLSAAPLHGAQNAQNVQLPRMHFGRSADPRLVSHVEIWPALAEQELLHRCASRSSSTNHFLSAMSADQDGFECASVGPSDREPAKNGTNNLRVWRTSSPVDVAVFHQSPL